MYAPYSLLKAAAFAALLVFTGQAQAQKSQQNHFFPADTFEHVTFQSVAKMVSDSFGAPVELVTEFIMQAKQMERNEGIPATAFIGIAILESGGFTSYLYQKAKNPFGMRATKIWKGPTFVMFHEGADAPFRKYDTPADAVRDFAKFLRCRKWFHDALICPPDDVECFLNGMIANDKKREPGYARDPEWSNKVRRVIMTYGLNGLNY